MIKANTRAKPKRKLFKILAAVTLLFAAMVCFSPTTFAAEETDTNANMAEVSEAASAKSVYSKSGDGLDSDDPQGNQFTNSGSSLPGLKAVAPNWSFLGLNTKTGLLKKGDADTATVPLKSLIIYKTNSDDEQTGETSNASTKAAQLPAVLQVNGLDSIKTGSIFNKGGRLVGGALLMLGLALTYIANIVIIITLWLIKSLNPLIIIQSLMNNSGYGVISLPTSWSELPLIGNLLDQNNVFGQVSNLILSWSIPALVILLFGIVMTLLFWLPYTRRSGTRGTLFNGLKWVSKRLVMLLILPSIAGSIFLAAFSVMSQGMQSPTAAMKGLVQSTFVQFSDWSDRSRLYLPDPQAFAGFTQPAIKANLPAENTKDASIKWTYRTPDRVPILPNYILAINAFGARDADAVKYFTENGSATTLETSTNSRGDGDDATPTLAPDKKLIQKELDSMGAIGNTFKVVRQWMNNSTYSTKSYAGSIENQYNADKNEKDQTLNQADAIKKDISDPKDQPKNFVSGYLQVSDNAIRYTASKGYFSDTNAGSVPAAESVEPLVKGTYAGLSPIGMWNYLNTKIQDGTVVQQDPRKTQDKTALSHASVVLPGGFALGSLSIGIILAFFAATIVPILAVSTMLLKVVGGSFVGWKHILAALGGSVKAWMHLAQQSIKLLIGMFMLGFVASLTPSVASFIVGTVDGFTSATNSTLVFGFGKALEIFLLLFLTYLLVKSSVVIEDVIGSIAPGAKSAADGASSIFDRGMTNAMDETANNSSSKLAKMMNDANLKDAKDNENFAHDEKGNLLRDTDGKVGIKDDAEIDPETGKPYLNKVNSLADESVKQSKDFINGLKDRVKSNSEAENLAERKNLTDEMSNAASELEKMGLGVPDSLNSDAIATVNDMIGDDNALATPEVLSAAKRLQNAAKGLEALDEADADKGAKDRVKDFASTLGDDAASFAKSTAAGKALTASSDFFKNRRKSVDETAAELAQLKSLAEGKPVDDSMYGAMTDEQRAELDKLSSEKAIDVPPGDVAKNIKSLSKLAPEKAETLKSKIAKLDTEIAKTATDANAAINSEHASSLTPGLASFAEDHLMHTAAKAAVADGHDADHLDGNILKNYSDIIMGDISKLDAPTNGTPFQNALAQNTGALAHELGRAKYVSDRLKTFNSDPNNTAPKLNKDGSINAEHRAELNAKRDALIDSANQNYDRSRSAMSQGIQATFDAIPAGEDRVNLLRTASINHDMFMNKQREDYMKANPVDPAHANDPQYVDAMEKSISETMLGNQPRNYGVFYSAVQKRLGEGMSRENALQESYVEATSRKDDYHLMPRDFNMTSNLLAGKDSAKSRASVNKANLAHSVLVDQRNKLAETLSTYDVSTPQARATSAGIQDFNNRTPETLPQLKRYMRPGTNQAPVGEIMNQLSDYTSLYRLHQNQQPVAGNRFTKLETAARAKVETRLATLRSGLISKGVANDVLSDSQKTSRMYEDLAELRNKFGKTYQDMANKHDKI